MLFLHLRDRFDSMATGPMKSGRISKVVHVRFSSSGFRGENQLDGGHGYGILQGDEGQDFFFVDTAVQNAAFTDLEVGQAVDYMIEPGPLGRANQVWLKTAPNQGGAAATDQQPGASPAANS